jgi:nucleoside 2-deoxyribosyltransferase
MKTVYLAGPITGLEYVEATNWRNDAKLLLALNGITGLSPMRGKEYLSEVKEFTMDGDKYSSFSVMSSNRGIMTRDRWDATRCDVLLVNLLDAKRVSIGTCMEIAWADAVRTPIVCVMEPTGNPHEHGMILEAIGFRTASLNEAIYIIKAILR